MPDIEYVKAFQKRMELQTQNFAKNIKILNPDAPVLLISKEGCAACVLLLTALEERGVAVSKVSVTHDTEAKQIYDKLLASGERVIFPITVVGDTTVMGNYPDEIMRLLGLESSSAPVIEQ